MGDCEESTSQRDSLVSHEKRCADNGLGHKWATPFILPSESDPQNRLKSRIFKDSDCLKTDVISSKKCETNVYFTTQNLPPKPKERGKILSYPKL